MIFAYPSLRHPRSTRPPVPSKLPASPTIWSTLPSTWFYSLLHRHWYIYSLAHYLIVFTLYTRGVASTFIFYLVKLGYFLEFVIFLYNKTSIINLWSDVSQSSKIIFLNTEKHQDISLIVNTTFISIIWL